MDWFSFFAGAFAMLVITLVAVRIYVLGYDSGRMSALPADDDDDAVRAALAPKVEADPT